MPSPEHTPATHAPIPTVPDLLSELAEIQARQERNQGNENVIERTDRDNRLSEIEDDLWATIGELDPTVK
jgi:hypothetical protein